MHIINYGDFAMKYFDESFITCRGSGKVCYSGREAGEIINFGKRHHRSDHLGRAKDYPRRKYYCKDCGYYHLTSMKAKYSEKAKCGNWDENYYNYYLKKKNSKKSLRIFA